MIVQAPYLRPWVRRALIPGIWLLYGAVMAAQTYFAYTREGRAIPLWSGAIVPSLIYSVLYMAMTPLILFLARRFPLERPRRTRNIAFHIVFSFMLAIVQKILADGASLLVQSAGRSPFPWDHLLSSVIGYFDYGILIYWIILLIHQALEYAQRIQAEHLRASRLETQLTQTRLDALRTQLTPHFLFNTLNSISALMDEDTAAADTMIARLGDFLRLTLENAGEQFVPLERELESLKTYVAIEQIRFQDKLDLRVEADPAALPALVPSFLWQPLVENAIHHGIETSGAGGRITVRASACDGVLQLQVQDNGSGLLRSSDGEPRVREGLGLSNTRAILEHLYGPAHRFELANAPEGGAMVTLEIPFVSAEDHERSNSHNGGGRRGARQAENPQAAGGRS